MKKAMKKIVFVNQDAGYLMIDIVNAHIAKGYECVLICGRLVSRNKSLHPDVKQEKIISYNRHGIAQRAYTWLVAFLQIFFLILFKYRNYELFIVSNPPFATHLNLYLRNKVKLLIYDIYPDAITEMGLMRDSSPIIKFWKLLNKRAYRKAENIYTLTAGMQKVLTAYTVESAIKVVPIWSDNNYFKPIDKKTNEFAVLHGLEHKFVVLYSGNLGMNNQLESMMYLAKHLLDNHEIVFVIIGDGDKKNELLQIKNQLQLTNVMFMDWQKSEILPYSLSIADIAVVSLDARASMLAIPSKMYNYLSVGSALLCIAPADSELNSFIKKYDCGKCYTSSQTTEMADYIKGLNEDKTAMERLKANALSASNDFTDENVNLFF